MSDLFQWSFPISSNNTEVFKSPARLKEDQGFIICKPFYLADSFTTSMIDQLSKLSLHITYKQFSPAYKSHFLSISSNIKIGDLIFYVKVLFFQKHIVPGKLHIYFIRLFTCDIINPKLIILFKYYFPTICIHTSIFH